MSRGTIGAIGRVVGAAGLIGVIIVAPNATQAFEKLAKTHRHKQTRGYVDYLRRSGYFEARKHGDRFVIRLSEKGREVFSATSFDEIELDASQEWRGKWNILMFDIPESHRKIRQYIARRLVSLGLRPLQDSVYVYPHDLSQLARAIRQTYPQVASLVISAKVDTIDGENQLRKAFKL